MIERGRADDDRLPDGTPTAVAADIDAVLSATRVALGEDLFGFYLIGSVALGDFQAATSDVDVIVLTAASLPMVRRHELADAVAAVPISVRGLEYVVYPRASLARFQSKPAWEINLNVGPRLPARHETFDPADELWYWAVLDLAVAASSAVALVGPEPAAVFPEIPAAQIAEALRESLAWHGAEDRASANRVLNACRAWLWLEEGQLAAKSVAADWALARTGDPLIAEALAIRATGNGSFVAADVDRFVELVGRATGGALRTG